jgi:hypothetical protein
MMLKGFFEGALAFLVPVGARPFNHPPVVENAVEENRKKLEASVYNSRETSEQIRKTMEPIEELLKSRSKAWQ